MAKLRAGLLRKSLSASEDDDREAGHLSQCRRKRVCRCLRLLRCTAAGPGEEVRTRRTRCGAPSRAGTGSFPTARCDSFEEMLRPRFPLHGLFPGTRSRHLGCSSSSPTSEAGLLVQTKATVNYWL